MQGKKDYQEKMFTSFQLSDRIPKENFYYRLKEALDLKFLYSLTEDFYGKSGQKSIDPVVFFKLCLVGYLENITSDRRLVSHCSMRLDILFFLNYDIEEELPWHSTISRTRQLFPETVFEAVFNKVLHLCIAGKMVSGHTQAIDSAPVKANASMENLELKIPQESSEDYLKKVKKMNPTTKAGIEKKREEKYRNKKNKEELKIGASKNKKKRRISNKIHYNPHDPDARISVKPGKASRLNYHCSLSVDTEEHVITDVRAYHADKKDGECLQDITIRTKSRLWREGMVWRNILADTNYSSGRDYAFLERQGIKSYIPPHGRYKGGPDGFTYIKEGNYWLCPQGKKAVYKRTDPNKGSPYNIYMTDRSDCKNCPIKETCIGKRIRKQLKITVYREEYERNIKRVSSKKGHQMSLKRQSTVEPVLGTLKEYMGLGKLTTIGIEQANKCMHMSAIAYNIKKYLKFISQKGKTGANVVQRRVDRAYHEKKALILSNKAVLKEFYFIWRSCNGKMSFTIDG